MVDGIKRLKFALCGDLECGKARCRGDLSVRLWRVLEPKAAFFEARIWWSKWLKIMQAEIKNRALNFPSVCGKIFLDGECYNTLKEEKEKC
jgi:hypothetical protein